MTERAQREPLAGWGKFLNPDNLRGNLLRASGFLSAYELMKSAIIDLPHGFFSGPGAGSRYTEQVLALHPNDTMHASCLWFATLVALSRDDITAVQRIRQHRNAVAHELPKFLVDTRHRVDMQLLDTMHFILAKIDRWWIREIEMPNNPEYDNTDPYSLPDSEIHSGRTLAMEIILNVVYGKDRELREAYRRFAGKHM